MKIFDFFKSKQKTKYREELGTNGSQVVHGYIQDHERNRLLHGVQKYTTYSNILLNNSIVSAGTHFFLNMAEQATWTFAPSAKDTSGEYADFAKRAILLEPLTPWAEVVKKACMSRFYGFSLQEIVLKKNEKGEIVVKDFKHRPQSSIDKWITNDKGHVLSVVQRSTLSSVRSIEIPIDKLLYTVNNSFTDSPEGVGLFRHLVEPALRLARYEQLEAIGFDTDLRGIPIGRAPLAELAELEQRSQTPVDREGALGPLRAMLGNQKREVNQAILLDSETYSTQDETGKPSNVYKYDLQLLKSASNGLPDIAAAIMRLNREMARVLGVEQLLLGENREGSFALADAKTKSLFLLVDSTLDQLADAVSHKVLNLLWDVNGLDPDLKPTIIVEDTKFRNINEITGALRDLAAAGAPLNPEDEVVKDIRRLLGLSDPLISPNEEKRLGF